jgi:hypothetical protein
MLVVLFWIWGGLGLILNILMIPSDNTLLLWIGGLLFFGLGGLLFPTAVSVEDTVKGQLLPDSSSDDRETRRTKLQADIGNNEPL